MSRLIRIFDTTLRDGEQSPGAAMNLARVFGTDLVAGHWTDFWYYWLGLIGGGAAGLLYEYLFAVPEDEG